MTSSLDVARYFEKRHDDVLKRLREMECSPEFNARNFAAVTYRDQKGEERAAVNMTRDGFTFLCMGFTGKKAAVWKEAYIKAFNAMEETLKATPVQPLENDLVKALRGEIAALREELLGDLRAAVKDMQAASGQNPSLSHVAVVVSPYEGDRKASSGTRARQGLQKPSLWTQGQPSVSSYQVPMRA